MGSQMALSNLTLSELKRSKSTSLRSYLGNLYGIDIYLPAVTFYHINLNVINGGLLAGKVFRCPSDFSCLQDTIMQQINIVAYRKQMTICQYMVFLQVANHTVKQTTI